MENYVGKDSHTCGDCGARFDNIEDFIYHKTETEKFNLDLIPSTKINNLLIPTFTNRSKPIAIDSTECDVCRKIFTQDFILQVHKPQPKWRKNCNSCGVHFKSDKSFQNGFGCRYKNCTYTFKTKGSLKRHERRHTGERPYNCELCGRNFTESGALKRHKQSRILCTSKSDSDLPRYGKRMEDNKLGNIVDGTDNAVLDDLDGSESEITNVRNVEGEKYQVCDICGSTFDEVRELRNHLMGHAGKEYVKCGVCKFVSYDKSDVIDHIENRHEDFSSETTHEVEVNLIIHDDTNNANKPLQNTIVYNCDVCAQTFETNDDLKTHLLNHPTKTQPSKEHYSCLVCSKQFPTKSKLQKHALSHSQQRNFRCSECGKLFKRINHARNHIKTTHSAQRPFVCVVCDKRFKTLSSLKTHVKIHEGDLPFACHICDKSFREKASLQRHVRTHTGEKPFVCRYCGHGFAEHGTLNRHLKAKLPCYVQSVDQFPNEELNPQHNYLSIDSTPQTLDITSCDPFPALDTKTPMLSRNECE